MSLLEEIKKLQELEQKATPGKWQWYNTHYPGGPAIIPESGEAIAELYQKTRPDEDGMFIAALRNLAPALLEVLGMIREGDAEMLRWILAETIDNGSEIRAMIERFKQMAELMEQEAREG